MYYFNCKGSFACDFILLGIVYFMHQQRKPINTMLLRANGQAWGCPKIHAFNGRAVKNCFSLLVLLSVTLQLIFT